MKNTLAKSLVLLTSIALYSNAGTLSKADMENLVICEKTPTGVSQFSSTILNTVTVLRNAGMKTVVTKSGSNLEMTFGTGNETTIIEFKQIDEGRLNKYNVTCYESQKLTSEKGEFTRADETLNFNTMNSLKIFGYSQPTEADIESGKNKQAQKKALKLLEEKKKYDQMQKLQAEQDAQAREERKIALELKKQRAEAKKISDKKKQKLDNQVKKEEQKLKRNLRKELRNKKKKYSAMIKKFETSSNITKLKDWNYAKNNLVLTDENLDTLMELLDKLSVEVDGVSDKIARRRVIKELEKFYDYDDSKRLQNQSGFYSNRYDPLFYDINNLIKKMK